MNRKIIYALHSLAWALTFIAGFSVYAQFIDPDTAFTRSLVNVGLLAALFYTNIYFIARYYEQNKKGFYYLLSAFLVLIVIAIRIFLNSIFATYTDSATIPEKPIVYISVTCITSVIIYILSSLLAVMQNRNKAEKRHLEQLNQLQQSQLKFLKAQINPHFLFNTLNNIYALVLTKSDRAPEMLVKLSELLRYAIYQEPDSKVNLKKELEQVSKYIELFRMRSKQPLPIQWTQALDDEDFLIPPMMLISLVENAFKHGDLSENANAQCCFNLETRKGVLHFSAENSFNPDKVKDTTRGIGLKNLEETLSILYPGNFEFTHRTKNGTFKIDLTITHDH